MAPPDPQQEATAAAMPGAPSALDCRTGHRRLMRLAGRLQPFTHHEPEAGLIAIAHAVLNAERTGRPLAPEPGVHVTRTSAPHENDTHARRRHRLRAIAIAARVLAGDFPDPTGGATRFHSHRAAPAWADRRRPIALIGSHFFYR